MASKIFGAIATTGGADGALDSLKEATISDGDFAIVADNTEEMYMYRYESSNNNDTNPQDDPQVVTPADNRDPGDTGAWILLDVSMEDLKVYGNAVIDGNLDVTGTITGSVTLSDDITVADGKNVVWDYAPASDQTGSGDIIPQTVDSNSVGIGGLMVLSSDGNWDNADADAEATVGRLALATQAGTGSKNLMLRGVFRDDSWNWTVGGQLFVSTTVGTMTQTAPSGSGDFVQVCGYALTADIIIFDPSPDYIEVK